MKMPETIENYTSQIVLKNLKKTAITAWSAGFILVFVWAFLILLAPLAEFAGATNISGSVYKFFSYLCHQNPERSFHLDSHAFAVCTRCSGVYFGLFFGFIIYPFVRSIHEIEPLSRIWLFLSLIPMGVDWSLGFFEIWENTHLSRFLTGLIVGAACSFYVVPALVEIFWHVKSKKQLKRLSR